MGLFSKQSKEAETKMVNNRYLSCQYCNHNMFFTRKAQLNTAGMSLLDMDWANKSATCYVCEQCGYIHWFLID